MTYQLIQGDCIDHLKTIPDGSVDLVLCDPPYGTIQGLNGVTWDIPLDNSVVFPELARVLRQNGRAILFGQEPFTSKLITEAIPSLPFAYRAIWRKDKAGNSLMTRVAMVNVYEDILVFNRCGHDYAGANPNREYFKRIINYVGSKKRIIEQIGGKADHTTRVNSSQFNLCTPETYAEMVKKFALERMEGYTPYDTLLERERAYKSDFESVFNLWEGKACKPNVLEYKKDPEHYHATQKPIALLEDLIKTYSNAGDTILDFTMGSGSTGVACVRTDRDFIGIELNDDYFEIAEARIREAKKDKETML